ncbi:MAG: hypothetical protein KDC75_19915 [Phaeodactylibacter sp.]|nr:hypothetical protein [Phaeodactylibacter sp.]
MSKLRYDPGVKRYVTKDQFIQESLGGLPNETMLIEQWEKLELVNGYDSEADTLNHIRRVAELLMSAAQELLERAKRHDASKLTGTEKAYFDIFTPRLAGSIYGSDEYMAMQKELKFALDIHFKENSHHPQHYKNGIDGMDLFDLLEMFLDWKAASERHNDGDINKSIEINEKRFEMVPQLAQIFKNTVKTFL